MRYLDKKKRTTMNVYDYQRVAHDLLRTPKFAINATTKEPGILIAPGVVNSMQVINDDQTCDMQFTYSLPMPFKYNFINFKQTFYSLGANAYVKPIAQEFAVTPGTTFAEGGPPIKPWVDINEIMDTGSSTDFNRSPDPKPLATLRTGAEETHLMKPDMSTICRNNMTLKYKLASGGDMNAATTRAVMTNPTVIPAGTRTDQVYRTGGRSTDRLVYPQDTRTAAMGTLVKEEPLSAERTARMPALPPGQQYVAQYRTFEETDNLQM